MIPHILRNFRKLETAKMSVLSELRGWPEGSLGKKPESGGWSALDVIEHLVLTERTIVETMRRNIGRPRRVRISDWLKNGIVISLMLLPARVRVPAGARQVVPTGETSDLSTLENQWNTARRDLAAFLEAAGEGDLTGGVVRHPAGGWTTIEGALWFLRSHLRHHRYQLSRIDAALRKPLKPREVGGTGSR
jgi:hypothetical protein